MNKNPNISYIIASYFGDRRMMIDEYLNNRYYYIDNHLRILSDLKHNIKDVYIVINITDNLDMSILYNIIKNYNNLNIIIMPRYNKNMSYGAWDYALKKTSKNYDYSFLIEDDYVPVINNFDDLFIDKMSDKIGYICQLYTGSENIQEHPSVSNGLLNNKSYNEIGFNIIDGDGYDGAQYNQIHYVDNIKNKYKIIDISDEDKILFLNSIGEIITRGNGHRSIISPIIPEVLNNLNYNETSHPIFIFSHNYLINDWERILINQLNLIKSSNLYNNITTMFMHSYGDDQNYNKFIDIIKKYDINNKIEINRIDTNFYEYPTLQKMYNFSQTTNNSHILYFHLKGVWSENDPSKDKQSVISWRKCLEYFNIEQWENCVQKLNDGYEVVGALYNYNPTEPLFSGNFWWTNTDYIKKLKYPQYNLLEDPYHDKPDNNNTWCRVECEKWINTIPNNFYNFYIPKDYGFYYVPIDDDDYKIKKNMKSDIIDDKIKNLLDKYRMFFMHDDVNGVNRLFGLYDLIKDNVTKNSKICEIGSFGGVSSELFAIHCKDLYCVDSWDDFWTPEGHTKDGNIPIAEMRFDDMSKNYNNIHKIKKYSLDAVNNFDNEYLDLVYIDAGHDYESTKNDILNWIPKIKKNGIICGHDYYSWGEDVKTVVDELFKNIPLKIYSDSSWLIKLEDYYKLGNINKSYTNYRGVIINQRGYWMNDHLVEESFDKNIFNKLLSIFKNKTVGDFGCGHGYYTKNLLDNGIYCEGYDGNPNTPILTNDICKVIDLSIDFDLNKKFDWILCLEVGEHIPEQYESTFINNIDKHCKDGIILSWAVTNQQGDGHVNCKNNDDVKKLFQSKGYYNDISMENELRNISEISWFKNTIMAFKKTLKISVIVPTYNRTNILRKCIDSVITQYYPNIEILVCHDGPSEKFNQFIEDNQLNNVQYFNTDRRYNNLGATQRNMMSNYTTGDYILYLDDDNILYDNYLNKMIKEIDNNTGMIVSRIHFNDKEWNNLILPKEDKLIPTQIDHLSILFKSNITKQFQWDNDWGQDHRFINNCEKYCNDNKLKIKYIQDVLASHQYLNNKSTKDDFSIVISSYPNHISSVKTTSDCIKSFKDQNFTTILTSHFPISDDLQLLSDFNIYDKNNILLEHDHYSNSWFETDEYRATINLKKYQNNLNHSLTVYMNYYNGVSLSKSLNYKYTICTNYDNIINNKDYDILDNITKELINSDKKGYFLIKGDNSFKTIFFVVDNEYFIEKFELLRSKNDYLQDVLEKKSSTNCLENYFESILKNETSNLIINQIEEVDLFPNSKINQFSNIEYFTVLQVKDNDRQFACWYSSSNQIDDRQLNLKVYRNGNIICNETSRITKNYRFYKLFEFITTDIYKIKFSILDNNNIIKNKEIHLDKFENIKYNGELILMKKIIK